MTTSLPVSIEATLRELGFSTTDIVVLRKLVEGESFTLRELAIRTGRSAGVLEQALRKLVQRRIVERISVNAHPCYRVSSLEALIQWIRVESKERRDAVERRQRDIERFVRTLRYERSLPDMRHYHGRDGIARAYADLADIHDAEELLTLAPSIDDPEHDPYREALVTLFRLRSARKIFHRVLAPESHGARRSRFRDVFELRRTLLVPPGELSLTVELTLAGDTVACIDRANESATLLRYPEFAQSIRALFELLWARQMLREHRSSDAEPTTVCPSRSRTMCTRMASAFRSFVLSQRMTWLLLGTGVAAGLMSMVLLSAGSSINVSRLRAQLSSIVAAGSGQFSPADIQGAQEPEGTMTPAYFRLISRLDLVRRSHPEVRFASLIHLPSNDSEYAFIADADDGPPLQRADTNADAMIDDQDSQPVRVDRFSMQHFPVMEEAREQTVTGFGQGSWASYLAAFSPVKDASGHTIAILAVGAFSPSVDRPSSLALLPLFFFVLCCILAGILRLLAHNRSMLRTAWSVVMRRPRLSALWTIFLILCFVMLCFAWRWYEHQRWIQSVGTHLMTIAANSVSEFDPADLEQLHWARDMRSEAYQRVFRTLNEIRRRNPGVTFAYIFRPSNDPHLLEFVADADSNWSLPHYSTFHIDDIPMVSDEFENVWPGYVYYDNGANGRNYPVGFFKPEYEFVSDHWGKVISGSAPIRYEDKTIGILGVDVQL